MDEQMKEDIKKEVTEGSAPEDNEPQEESNSFLKEFLNDLKILVVAFIVCLVLTRVVFVNAHVPSSSMENTIMTGDRVLGFRLAYTFGEPERGDIIIFKYPVDEDVLYIKRVIGLPGETVSIDDGNIYVDGVLLEEDYLPEEWVSGNDGYVFEVPEGHYLMMGDNRNVSVDARYWAAEALAEGIADSASEADEYTYVAKEKMVAKALFVFWPFKDIRAVW